MGKVFSGRCVGEEVQAPLNGSLGGCKDSFALGAMEMEGEETLGETIWRGIVRFVLDLVASQPLFLQMASKGSQELDCTS